MADPRNGKSKGCKHKRNECARNNSGHRAQGREVNRNVKKDDGKRHDDGWRHAHGRTDPRGRPTQPRPPKVVNREPNDKNREVHKPRICRIKEERVRRGVLKHDREERRNENLRAHEDRRRKREAKEHEKAKQHAREQQEKARKQKMKRKTCRRCGRNLEVRLHVQEGGRHHQKREEERRGHGHGHVHKREGERRGHDRGHAHKREGERRGYDHGHPHPRKVRWWDGFRQSASNRKL